jgi:hypothetical protein
VSRIDFFMAMRKAFDPEQILKVLCDLCAAYGRKEIDRNTMGSLLVLAHSRNDAFYQGIRRQKGAESMKKKAAQRHAAWQSEACKIAAAHPTWKKGAVADQVRINLGCQVSADTISRVIKIPS